MAITNKGKGSEESVTPEIIDRVHHSLADAKSGEEIINFLRATEPCFINEVHRFIQTEMSRMRYSITETQAIYIGSVIGASYIAGFLIAREAGHKVFDGQFTFKDDIRKMLTPLEFDRIVDEKRKEGKGYRSISNAIKNMLEGKTPPPEKKQKKLEPVKNDAVRLDIGDLG